MEEYKRKKNSVAARIEKERQGRLGLEEHVRQGRAGMRGANRRLKRSWEGNQEALRQKDHGSEPQGRLPRPENGKEE